MTGEDAQAAQVRALWADCQRMAEHFVTWGVIALEETAKAIGDRPGEADVAWHIHNEGLLAVPRRIYDLGNTGVYRAHCAELLARPASGTDLRLPTSAEITVVCCHVSENAGAPLGPGVAGLYLRHFARVFPSHPMTAENAEYLAYLEHAHGYDIAEYERAFHRRGMTTKRRLDPALECSGTHDGVETPCRFAGALITTQDVAGPGPAPRRRPAPPRRPSPARPPTPETQDNTLF